MKVSVVQAATLLGQPQKNRIKLEASLHELVHRGTDVVLFPETWDVGFIPENIAELAEDPQRSASLKWMKEWAKSSQVNVVGGSIVVKEGRDLYNRCYVINRQGEVVYEYDKAHLFSPGREAEYMKPGSQNKIFHLDGIPCAVQICYDLRFPELSRRLALEGAQLLFVPAQWPHPRSNHWITLNQARAIENQCYVIATNGCGYAGSIQSCGYSAIYDPWGEVVLTAGEDEVCLTATLDLKKVAEARGKIPVFADRQPLLYS